MFLPALIHAWVAAAMDDTTIRERAADWAARFGFAAPEASPEGVCRPGRGELPAFTVLPAAAGRQLVRVSLPFPSGSFPSELGLQVHDDDGTIQPDVRVLTLHPGRPACVRRALVTFPFEFPDTTEHRFTLSLRTPETVEFARRFPDGVFRDTIGDLWIEVSEATVEVAAAGRQPWRAGLIAPDREWSVEPTVELVERGRHYVWVRLLVPDVRWPRIIEVRADTVGTVAATAHLQRMGEGDASAPDLGWRVEGPPLDSIVTGEEETAPGQSPVEHGFSAGEPAWVRPASGVICFPDAHLKRRGILTARNTDGGSALSYLRCRAEEEVPHQEAAWRTASFVLAAEGEATWNSLLEPAHEIRIPTEAFDSVYGCGSTPELSPWKPLDAIRRFHIDAVARSSLLGDDFGNITSHPAGVFGMNRLNHCPAIFEEYYRSGDARLRAAAVRWCANFHDLSIWWGTGIEGQFGGTRYNNVSRHSDAHRDDKSFMWRSNRAVSFCTKGYDSFLYAYEETGDPRMAAALRWQIAYAREMVHVDTGECRNIGDAADFVRLYRFTGRREYLEEALRLFRELRNRLSAGDLFSQGGQPIEEDAPFIDDDPTGSRHPFAKPYIIGYALAGLPALAEHCPDEPKLRDVIRAVADFLAESGDPAGGWRYPHPRSTSVLVSQGMEHGAQLARAAAYLESRGEPVGNLLTSIEAVLRSRILAWMRTGTFFSGLGGWEAAAGILRDGTTVYDLYAKPGDRDPARDYTEGSIGLGSAPPEGLVYFPEVLGYYLSRRPPERLLSPSRELQQLLDRMPRKGESASAAAPSIEFRGYGVHRKLPAFCEAQLARLSFPLAFDPGAGTPFPEWRGRAREHLLRCLLTRPPRASFDPAVIAREDRGTYEARKVVFNVSADCRIPAYVLVPEGEGPFPAVIALHDHGAHFSIGKEKVVRPFQEPAERLADAESWVEQNYGGRFIGDVLARRGYVVFAMDALYWGDRGRREGVNYEAQQELASNLFQLGMSWAGVITWDDIRSAEFVASLPEVDPERIGAVGLSMGSHRTWMLCAASDRVAAGVAVCWMATTDSLMVPGNNQIKGYSAFSMLHPDLRNHLDYADAAAIACPKPMMFFNGELDALFPIDGVNAAYARMRRVWESQAAGDRLVTRIWPGGHAFTVEMQREAFGWLDACLGGAGSGADRGDAQPGTQQAKGLEQ